jgi:hypothetical protein
MIGPTLASLGPNIAGQLDQNGRLIRFPATAGSVPLYLPCQEYFPDPDKQHLVECESLKKTLAAVLSTTNPLKAPAGTAPVPAGDGH